MSTPTSPPPPEGQQPGNPQSSGSTPPPPPSPESQPSAGNEVPPGYYPPPSDQPAYGQQPYGQSPYGQAPYGQPGYPPAGYGMPPAGFVPPRPYAGWWQRVAAVIIDGLLAFAVGGIIMILGFVIAFMNSTEDPYTGEVENVNPLGIILVVIGAIAYLAFIVWNRGIRTGQRGQSFGRQFIGIEVISSEHGRYLGAGMGFLRWLLDTIFANICFVNYLWPLWDEKKRTWHDMIVSSIVIRK